MANYSTVPLMNHKVSPFMRKGTVKIILSCAVLVHVFPVLQHTYSCISWIKVALQYYCQPK